MTAWLAAIAVLVAAPGLDPQFGEVRDPAWSPDGTKIAYVLNPTMIEPETPTELRVVRADGSGLRIVVPSGVTSKGAHHGEPQWTADGSAIVFASYALATRVYRVAPDGTGLQVLADGARPRLARGAGIVFFAGDDGLGSVGVNGGTPKRYGVEVDEFDVTRDGSLVAFTRNGDLHVLDVRTGAVRQLTRTKEQETVPRFSPDGGRIAFGRGWAFYVLSLPGGNVRPLARIARPRQFPSPPAWSPDGREVALASFQLVIAAADGSRVRRATRTLGSRVFGVTLQTSPSWSPNGRRILFAGSPPCQDDYSKLAIVPRGGGFERYLRDDCVRIGTPGADRLRGSAANNFILGRGGDDRISTGAGEDVAFGGAGDDTIVGGRGKENCIAECNRLEGEAGDDTLIARATAASLDGGVGADRLRGGPGDDDVNAQDGFRDRIACGGGRDFVLADRLDVVARDCERVARRRRR